jgi:hypothetical protein
MKEHIPGYKAQKLCNSIQNTHFTVSTLLEAVTAWRCGVVWLDWLFSLVAVSLVAPTITTSLGCLSKADQPILYFYFIIQTLR